MSKLTAELDIIRISGDNGNSPETPCNEETIQVCGDSMTKHSPITHGVVKTCRGLRSDQMVSEIWPVNTGNTEQSSLTLAHDLGSTNNPDDGMGSMNCLIQGTKLPE